MPKLQDDIRLVGQLNSPIKEIREATTRVVETARRVANPDFDAISQAADRYAELWGENPIMVRNVMHQGAAMALGITEGNPNGN
jgi:hypothetical protein